MITVKTSENIGNTFLGLVATAFESVRKNQNNVKIDPFAQHGDCGTIEVKENSTVNFYDWIYNNDRSEIKFIPSV